MLSVPEDSELDQDSQNPPLEALHTLFGAISNSCTWPGSFRIIDYFTTELLGRSVRTRLKSLFLEVLDANRSNTDRHSMMLEQISSVPEIIAINLTAPFLFSQLAANLMKSKKVKGSIVNITSISADLPMPNSIAYNVSKAGLKNLTKSYAIDFANCGIRINNLSPGYTRSKMTKKSWNNKKKRLQRTNKTTLLRWANPEDYNEAVGFLIDSKKSGYMTGSDLIIDGGWTIKGM